MRVSGKETMRMQAMDENKSLSDRLQEYSLEKTALGLALDKLGRGREIAVVLSRMAVVTTVSSPAAPQPCPRPANT